MQYFVWLCEANSQLVLINIRRFCLAFQMKGEAQVLERIMQNLSECISPRVGVNPDNCFVFLCALLMLNTDLHNKDIKEKMRSEVFKKNLRRVVNEVEASDDIVEEFYKQVQQREIRAFDPNRIRNFSLEEFIEYCFLHERVKEKMIRCFFPEELAKDLLEIQATGGVNVFGVVGPIFENKFLSSLPTLMNSFYKN